MTTHAAQIVALYETNGLDVKQISEIEKLPEVVIKAVLNANSPKFRGESKTKVDLNFTDDDAHLAISAVRRIVQNSEDDSVVLKGAMFLINDKKGRLDVQKGLKKLNLNLTALNEHFQRAADSLAERVSPAQQQKVIDV